MESKMRTKICMDILVLTFTLLSGISSRSFGQYPAALASDPDPVNWSEPAAPTKIAGPVYFVGTKGLAVWLITTTEGHILLNTGTQGSGPLIEASIRKLGFKPEDIKILLICHAHFDHVGGLAYMKKLSGAQIAVIDREVDLLQSGGKTDFHYGHNPSFAFEPVKTDRVFHDGDTITLGNIAMTANLTPGHTKGTTTWTMKVTDTGKLYTVVFPDGTSVNPGYRVARNPSYPGIGDDYRRTFQTLESLKPDIWLAPHNEVSDFAGKRARAANEGVTAWVDPDGYKTWVAARKAQFEAAVSREMAESPKPQ